VDIPPQLRVRELNPDGPPLEGDCCPDAEDDIEFIEAAIVDGEIQLQRRKKPDADQIYRSKDYSLAFQLMVGYPRWCCLKFDCDLENPDDGHPTYVERYLHFPRWPAHGESVYDVNTDTYNPMVPRDPYHPTPASREEPLSIIPVVVDIQCDFDSGLLYVYRANIVVHDGIIAAVQWNVDEPRENPGSGDTDPTVPPLKPSDLTVNEDYQGKNIFTPILFDTPETDLDGGKCDETCAQAATHMGFPSLACTPLCPTSTVFSCQSGYHTEEVVGTGASPEEAYDDAIAKAGAGCIANYLCFTTYDEGADEYNATVQFCCPDP
jgi:hypothetical protein